MKKLAAFLALAALALAATALFHHRVAFGGQTFEMIGGLGAAPSDPNLGRPVADPLASSGQFEPWLDHLIRERERHGRTPLWNPWQGCGAPFLANAQTAVFHPIRYVQAYLPQGWRLDAAVLARIALGFLGMLLLCRLLDLGLPACLAGGAAFAFAGYFQFYANMVHVGVEVLLPWHVLGVELAFRGRIRWGALIFGGSIVLSHLGGFPESTALVLLVPLLWGLARLLFPGHPVSRGRIALAQSLAVVLGTALCLPVLLPFLEYVGNSVHLHATERWVGLTGVRWENHGMIVPNLARHGAGINGPYGFQEPPYLGLSVVTLALLGALSLAVPRERRFGLAFFVLFTALVVAKYFRAPRIQELGRLPVLSQIIMVKYLNPLIAFGFAGLAAYGLDFFTRRLWGRFLLLLPLGLLVWHLAGHVRDDYDLPVDPWLRSPPMVAASALLLGALTATLTSAWKTQKRVAMAVGFLIALVVAGELYAYAPRRRGSREKAQRAPAQLHHILDRVRGERLVGIRGVFPPNWATRYEVQDARFLDALVPAGYHRFMDARFGVPLKDRWDGPIANDPEMNFDALDELGVRYLLGTRPWLRGVRQPSLTAATRGGEPKAMWRRTEPGRRFLDLPPGSKLFLGPLTVPTKSPPRIHVRSERIGSGFLTVVAHELGPRRQLFATPRRTLASLQADYPSAVATVPLEPRFGGLEPEVFANRPVLVEFLPWIGDHGISAARLEISNVTWGGERIVGPVLERAGRLAAELSPDEEHGIVIDPRAAPHRLWLPPTDETRLGCRMGLNLQFPPAASGDTQLRIEVRARPVLASHAIPSPVTRGEYLVLDLAEHRGKTVYLELTIPDATHLRYRETRLEGQVSTYRTVYEDWISLLENRGAAPTAFLVHDVEVVEEEDLSKRLRAPDLAPQRRALVSGPDARSLSNQPPIAERAVRIERPHSDRLLLHVAPQTAALLVVTETWDPGWKVKVDGRRVPLIKAFGAFRAVYLEDGDRFVEMTYAPDSYTLGRILASLSGAIAILVLLGSYRRSHARSASNK